MRTKLEIAIGALEYYARTLYDSNAKLTLEKIKAMPDENCGSCENFLSSSNECCRGMDCVPMTKNDFCSRYEVEK